MKYAYASIMTTICMGEKKPGAVKAPGFVAGWVYFNSIILRDSTWPEPVFMRKK